VAVSLSRIGEIMGVVGVRGGVKSFGETAGNQARGDGLNNVSAGDKGKLGGEDLGAVLNKVADANWQDPSKKMRTAGNPNMDKDAFFKLMLAQLKNQDPTNPLKSHEMAAQLASFSSLEQMQNMNTTLNEIKMGQKPSESYQALNLLGKSVAGDSSRITRNSGDKEHFLEFELPLDCADVSVKIRNAEGTVVRAYDLKNLKKGVNKVNWNGLDEKSTAQPEGEYHASIEGKTAEGKKVAVKTEFEGVITGVNYTKTGPVLLVGHQAIHMKDVKKIIDPSLMKNDQKIENEAAPDLKKDSKVVEDKKSALPVKSLEGAPKQSTKSILNQVALSREMMDKLAKETRDNDKHEGTAQNVAMMGSGN